MVMMGWLLGVKGDANGDRPCRPEPTAPGGDVAVEAMTEPALSRSEPRSGRICPLSALACPGVPKGVTHIKTHKSPQRKAT